MTSLDLEEILRRELHAAAESIEPAADGLNQIRARLSAPRPLAIAWLMVGWTSVGQPTLLRLDQVLVAFGDWLRAVARPVTEPLQPLADRLAPAIQPALRKARALFGPRTETGGHSSRYAWLRPALVMAAVVAIAVAGGFALTGLPRQIQQAAQSMLSNPAHTTKNGQGSNVTGNGKPMPTPGAVSPTPKPSATCSPSRKHKATPSPSSTPSPTPTPTPTPTVGSSPTPSPPDSPSPTPSASGDDPTTSSPASGQSASETSDVSLNSAATDKPTPDPSCTASSGS
jgi:type II secretory pathway pseudopilin PulG